MDKDERRFFVLGTLSDYMGRLQNPDIPDLLDHYDPGENPLVYTIDSVLKSDYPLTSYQLKKDVSSNGIISYSILSTTLVKIFNSYYDFEQSGSSAYGQPILTGKLKNDVFKTNSEKLAFLSGVYVRFGLPNDTAYLINIGNSMSKAQACFNILKEFHCKPSYQILHNIPTIHQIYFHPGPIVKGYFNKYIYLRKALTNSKKAFTDQIISKRKDKR